MSRNNPTVEEVEEMYNTRPINDIGMVKALRKAGWSIRKIANEFRCSEGRMAEIMRKEGIA